MLSHVDSANRPTMVDVGDKPVTTREALARGEIVAFIDDDALPEFDWLQQALPAFADHDVGGVGGIVGRLGDAQT